MDDRIELVSGPDGIAVLGETTGVMQFLSEAGLEQAPSRPLALPRLQAGSAMVATGSRLAADAAADSGRWVKLTAESAARIKQFGLTPTATPGVSHAMIGKAGASKHWLQIVDAPSTLLAGPFALSALATVMQQRAMQAQMDEIVAYLQELTEKVDDILRGQKDAVLADVIGVDLVVEEALTIREQVGSVSDITWSKVQSTVATLARTQAFALRRLDAIAGRLEKQVDLGDVASATKKAEPEVRDWLAVLAHTFRLQEGVAVLELDRVLAGSPDDLESHRRGLSIAHQRRLALITDHTDRLLAQMDDVVQRANARVLLNPFDSPAAVKSSAVVARALLDFRDRLGIAPGEGVGDAKRWGEAAAEVRDKAVSAVSDGVTATRRFGVASYERAADALRPAAHTADAEPDPAPEEPRRPAPHTPRGAAAAVGWVFARKREPHSGPASSSAVEEGPPT